MGTATGWVRPAHAAAPTNALRSTQGSVSFPQQAYVWQRAWTDPVRVAVVSRAPAFSRLVVLQAEVQWTRLRPEVARVPVDLDLLRSLPVAVAPALRVGSWRATGAGSGATGEGHFPTPWIAELAAGLLAEWRSHGVQPAELQIDFDAAERRLEEYRVWLEAVRARVRPTPVVFTALPAWLRQPAFPALVEAADGFVLQVHSLEAPPSAEASFTLCDPTAARAAVDRASAIAVAAGRPFRVALPTYGYRLGFDPAGKFLGLSAEAAAPPWPAGTRVREVSADPAALAALMARWRERPPAGCAGVIWYRLPVSGESLNWSWPTLSMVMAGRSPSSSLRAAARCDAHGLVEVAVLNEGQARPRPGTGSARVRLEWTPPAARVVASDGLQGTRVSPIDRPGRPRLELQAFNLDLRPGERRMIGWVRFNQKVEVDCAMEMDDEDSAGREASAGDGPAGDASAGARGAGGGTNRSRGPAGR